MMRFAQRRAKRLAVRFVVAVNDELHGAVFAFVVALAHIQRRLPAFDVDRLKNAGLGVRVGIDISKRRRPIRKFDQPQAANRIFVVVGEQRP